MYILCTKYVCKRNNIYRTEGVKKISLLIYKYLLSLVYFRTGVNEGKWEGLVIRLYCSKLLGGGGVQPAKKKKKLAFKLQPLRAVVKVQQPESPTKPGRYI